jgi:hypothetical protein
LQNLLSQFNDRGVIIGGVAASLLGTPRYTVDLDAVFLLSIDDLPRLLEKAAEQGIEPRTADPLGFARVVERNCKVALSVQLGSIVND